LIVFFPPVSDRARWFVFFRLFVFFLPPLDSAPSLTSDWVFKATQFSRLLLFGVTALALWLSFYRFHFTCPFLFRLFPILVSPFYLNVTGTPRANNTFPPKAKDSFLAEFSGTLVPFPPPFPPLNLPHFFLEGFTPPCFHTLNPFPSFADRGVSFFPPFHSLLFLFKARWSIQPRSRIKLLTCFEIKLSRLVFFVPVFLLFPPPQLLLFYPLFMVSAAHPDW